MIYNLYDPHLVLWLLKSPVIMNGLGILYNMFSMSFLLKICWLGRHILLRAVLVLRGDAGGRSTPSNFRNFSVHLLLIRYNYNV
jgi:hypothetical protein